MEDLFAAFLGVAAFSATMSVIAFTVAFFSRHVRYPITRLRGGTVLVGGWLVGSVIVLVVKIIVGRAGFFIHDNGSGELVIGMCVLFPIMFFLFDLSKPKQPPQVTNDQEQPNL